MKRIPKLLLVGLLACMMLPVQADEEAAIAEEEVEVTVTEEVVTDETVTDDYETWENIRWKFDETTATLYIAGEGAVPSYPQKQYPWYQYRNKKFTAVVVEEGITELNASSIHLNQWSYTSLSLPSTLTYIDPVMLNVFNNSLKEITVAEGSIYFAQDNVLYRKDGEEITLVSYPAGLENTSFTVPENVDHIGGYSFSSTCLTSLSLPEGLQSIGAFAFRCCTVLRLMEIPVSISDIHDLAFHYCEGLESFVVDEENPYYDSKDGVLFTEGMDMLCAYPMSKPDTEYTVPDGVRSVLSALAMTASELEVLYLPASVEEWAYTKGDNTPDVKLRAIYVDEANPNLTSENGILYNKDKSVLLQYPYALAEEEYRMPDTVTVMQVGSFQDTAYLRKIWWGKNLVDTGWMNELPSNVTEVYFPGDVPAWLNDLCFRIASTATLYYPVGNETWTDGSMTVDGYTYVTAVYTPETDASVTEDGYTVWGNIQWKFDDSSGTLYIRGTGGIPDEARSDYPWYSDREQIREIVVQEGITVIPAGAMDENYSVEIIRLPSTLTSIQHTEFMYSTTLTDFDVAEGGKYYDVDGVLFSAEGDTVTLECYPFGRREKETLDSYTVPEGVTHLGVRAFNRSRIREIILPDSLVSIADHAIAWTSELTTLHIPANVSSITEYSFWELYNLSEITIDEKNAWYEVVDGVLFDEVLEVMYLYPLADTRTSYTVPDTVVSMPGEPISITQHLESITIPASVRYIDLHLFSGACSMQNITVEEGNAYWSSVDGVLYNNDRTVMKYYPPSKPDVEFTIPDTVFTLETCAFYAPRYLKSLYIGRYIMSVEHVYFNALTEMYFPGDVPAWLNNMCGDISSQVTLYYPEGNTTWTDGSMTVDGYTYTTAAYTPEEDESVTEDGYTVWGNIEWKFDSSSGTLYIRGTGTMPDLAAAEYPWSTLGYSVTDLVIEKGITTLTQKSMSQIYPYRVQYPSTLVSAGNAFMRLNNQRMQSYTVTEGGRYYAIDGVLFSSDGDDQTLVHMPYHNDIRREYAIPEGTTHLGELSMVYLGLTDVTFPDSLQSIAYRALGYTNITAVSLGANVNFIDPAAFIGCTGVKVYTVDTDNPNFITEDGVLYTADGTDMIAYPYSNGVTEFSIPDGVIEVPLPLLYYSVDLQTLNIPASVTSIISEGGSYDTVSSLQQVNVDAANTAFCSSEGVLYSADMRRLVYYPTCKTDTLYVIPSTVKYVNNWAIFGNNSLKALVIPESVTSIRTATDPKECANLTEIYFTGDLPSYWNNGDFGHYANISKITLHYPEGASGWTEGTWTSSSGYTFQSAFYPDGTAPWEEYADYVDEGSWEEWNGLAWKFSAATGTLTVRSEGEIPDDILSSFPWSSRRSEIKHIVVESGITGIPQNAFSGCYNLKSVSLPASLETMDVKFLRDSAALNNITVEEGGVYYSENNVLFMNADSYPTLLVYPVKLTASSYTVPEGIKYLADDAFYSNTVLTELILPESLVEIGNQALGIRNLEALHIPKNVQKIADRGIFFCNVLSAITVDEENPYFTSVDGILYSADMTVLHTYPRCHPAVEFSVPDTVTEMTSGIYTQGTNLKKLHLPAALEYIRMKNCWSYMNVLEEITVDEANEYFCSVDGILYSKDMTVLYRYPNLHAGTEFRIPDSVTTLEMHSLMDAELLETLYIGSGVSEVEGALFNGNSMVLAGIYFPGDFPEYFNSAMSSLAFSSIRENITIYYPEGASGWTTPVISIYGYDLYTEPYIPEKHTHTYEITAKTDPTCTAAGSITYTCSGCTEAEYTEEIVPLGHDFGTLVVVKSATVLEEGSGYCRCQRCGYEQEQMVEKLTVDPDDPNYGIAYFTVKDAATLEPLENIQILLTSGTEGQCTLITDENGQAAQVMPVGRQTISVYGAGYQTRNLNVNIVSGTNSLPVIGLSTRNPVQSELTVQEMTYEEIVEAGIDVEDPDNVHIFKHSIQIDFLPSLDVVSMDVYFDDTGTYWGGSYTPTLVKKLQDDDTEPDDSTETDDSGTSPDSSTPVPKDRGDRKFTFLGDDYTITVYPVSEKFYLIIYGETKWLKEMFDVELLVMNNSLVDTIHDAEASLELPEGMSLADMVTGVQQTTVAMDTIDTGGQASVHWYVRGDEEGSYCIGASLKGLLGEFDEAFAYTYTSEPVKVYAGNALQMNVVLPYSTYYNDDYTVRIELENVSDRTLYNVKHAVTGLEQGKVTYNHEDGTVTDEILLKSGEQTYVETDAFAPGDKMVVEVSTNILFQSEVMEQKKAEMISRLENLEHFADAIDLMTLAKDLGDVYISWGESKAQTALDVLQGAAEAAPWGEEKQASAEELTAAIENMVYLMKKELRYQTQSTMHKYQSTGVYDELNTYLADENSLIDFYTRYSSEEILSLAKSIRIISENTGFMGAGSIFDSLQTMIEAIPVSFYVEDVIVSTLEGSTTSIPYTITYDTEQKVQYFGIDSLDNYLRSTLIRACGPLSGPIYQNRREEGIVSSYSEAVEYLKTQKSQAVSLMASDASGETVFSVYLNPAAESSVSAELTEVFTVTCTNDTAVYENGVLTFTGGSMIELLPAGETGASVCVAANGELLTTYAIELVDDHSCASDTWVIGQPATDDCSGVRVKYCDVCGNLAGLETVPCCTEHTWEEIEVVEAEAGEDSQGLCYTACGVCGYRAYSFYTESDTGEENVAGDITGDGKADADDLSMLTAYFSGHPIETDLSAVDFDGDGKLTRKDVMIFARYLDGWDGYDEIFRE